MMGGRRMTAEPEQHAQERCDEVFVLGGFVIRCEQLRGHNTADGYLHHADIKVAGRTPCIEWDDPR